MLPIKSASLPPTAFLSITIIMSLGSSNDLLSCSRHSVLPSNPLSTAVDDGIQSWCSPAYSSVTFALPALDTLTLLALAYKALQAGLLPPTCQAGSSLPLPPFSLMFPSPTIFAAPSAYTALPSFPLFSLSPTQSLDFRTPVTSWISVIMSNSPIVCSLSSMDLSYPTLVTIIL